MEAFTSCPLAFRFASIEGLPEPPSEAATKGSLVHRALELLFVDPRGERHAESLDHWFEVAWNEFSDSPDVTELHLDPQATEAFRHDAHSLAHRYLAMENPEAVRDIGVELRLEADLGDVTLRGIIDRLDLDDDNGLVISDYKTGRSPGPRYVQQRLNSLHLYALLCTEVLGRTPGRLRLLYLRDGRTVETEPDAQSVRFAAMRTHAVWRAVEKACTTGRFDPRPGPLCNSCTFQRWCPAFGGQPDLARVEIAGST
jgi:putative RecB family exonuclease